MKWKALYYYINVSRKVRGAYVKRQQPSQVFDFQSYALAKLKLQYSFSVISVIYTKPS